MHFKTSLQNLKESKAEQFKNEIRIAKLLIAEDNKSPLYLEIEKVRFGHRLQVEINIDSDNMNASLTPLLLQPIVENAIKFGLYDTVEDFTISISSHLENSYLHVQIKNPFDSDTQQANEGTGFGLSSIQRRLFLLYARNDLMTTEKKDNQFITTLKIPQK